MGFSILDPHPNNECIDYNSKSAWFSFIFCGSHIDTLHLHAYDYYTGNEIASYNTKYESAPAFDTKLKIWNGVGNGVRVNICDFVKDSTVFSTDGEYTWRAELVQKIDVSKGLYPDNMVYEGVLHGEPNFYAVVDNLPAFPYDNYLPLTPDYSRKIKPPYYIDFLDPKFNGQAYDIPITFDKTCLRSDGRKDTAVQLNTYTSLSTNSDSVLRPSIGSRVLIHKRENFGNPVWYSTSNPNQIYIDINIPNINQNDSDNSVVEGCYLKVGNEYFKIISYDRQIGLLECQNGNKLRNYPAGIHYAIYTSRFWTPYYYFRVHTMPSLAVDAEFHEHRRICKEDYDDTPDCLENTFNGILFKAHLTGDPHSFVKYHYWDIYSKSKNKLVYKTEKIYSQEMDCEVFVPYGDTYIGKITAVTQDGITVRNEVEYKLPFSPDANNKRLYLTAKTNNFGGVRLAWRYNMPFSAGTLETASQYEVFRIEKNRDKLKYLGKVDVPAVGISGIKPAHSGAGWFLIDKSCGFKLTTPSQTKVNFYLVGGGRDGGGWTAAPNDSNKSFAVGKTGGDGGYVLKKQIVSSGYLDCSAIVAERNDTTGTSLKIGDKTYRCNDAGSEKTFPVHNSAMTQSGNAVIYTDAENGANGFLTPYGYVGSSGGGGAACGNNRVSGEIRISGVTPKKNEGNYILIDRDNLTNGKGEFDLNIPDGASIKIYLVGGGCDGAKWQPAPNPGWDLSASVCYPGSEGGYVLTKELYISGSVHCSVTVADRNDTSGTSIKIGDNLYKCNDSSAGDVVKRGKVGSAAAAKMQNGDIKYFDGGKGADGVKTPYGYVGSSGGGGGADNIYHRMNGGQGGEGAGDGGNPTDTTAENGRNATNYGCGGGGGSVKEKDFNGDVIRSEPGKGMSGCVIIEISKLNSPCPVPGIGGFGAGNGGYTGDDGEDAVNYGCGGGGSGYNAFNSNGSVTYGKTGLGMRGCIIVEILIDDSSGGRSEISVVDWTAASDKDYRYIVTGLNYERAYRTARHSPEEMIECTASVDITPHFEDFYLYFLDEADVLVKTEYSLENYDVPLIEPMGRYVTSRNNPYKTVKRHMNTLSLTREDVPYYRMDTWRIEGDVVIDKVNHNISRTVQNTYSKMPAVTIKQADYDSFSLSFLYGYLNCASENGGDFEFNNQTLFEIWKWCVANRRTVMIKDPKGNVWTGVITAHDYQVEYDTYGMPYVITISFTQTRTEQNTLVMITDEKNKFIHNAVKNYLK